MGELFDPKARHEWTMQVMDVIDKNAQHTFQILTKQPTRAAEWWFPENCWVGTSLTGEHKGRHETESLTSIGSHVHFISLEPILGDCLPDFDDIEWLIIGAQTGPRAIAPNPWWIENAITMAWRHGVRVFVKNNVKASSDHWKGSVLPTEFPKEG